MEFFRTNNLLQRCISLIIVIAYLFNTSGLAATVICLEDAATHQHERYGTVQIVDVEKTSGSYDLRFADSLAILTGKLLLRDKTSSEIIGQLTRQSSGDLDAGTVVVELADHATVIEEVGRTYAMAFESLGDIGFKAKPLQNLLLKGKRIDFLHDLQTTAAVQVDAQEFENPYFLSAGSLRLKAAKGRNLNRLFSASSLVLDGDWENTGTLGALADVETKGERFVNPEGAQVIAGNGFTVHSTTYVDEGMVTVGGVTQLLALQVCLGKSYQFAGHRLLMEVEHFQNEMTNRLTDAHALQRGGSIQVNHNFTLNAKTITSGNGIISKNRAVNSQSSVLKALRASFNLDFGREALKDGEFDPLASGVFITGDEAYHTGFDIDVDEGTVDVHGRNLVTVDSDIYNESLSGTVIQSATAVVTQSSLLGKYVKIFAPKKEISAAETLLGERLELSGGQTVIGDLDQAVRFGIKQLLLEEAGDLELHADFNATSLVSLVTQGLITGSLSFANSNTAVFSGDKGVELDILGKSNLKTLDMRSKAEIRLNGVATKDCKKPCLEVSDFFLLDAPHKLITDVAVNPGTLRVRRGDFFIGRNASLVAFLVDIKGDAVVSSSPIVAENLNAKVKSLECSEEVIIAEQVDVTTLEALAFFGKLKARRAILQSKTLSIDTLQVQQADFRAADFLGFGTASIGEGQIVAGQGGIICSGETLCGRLSLVSHGSLSLAKVKAESSLEASALGKVGVDQVDSPQTLVQGATVRLKELTSENAEVVATDGAAQVGHFRGKSDSAILKISARTKVHAKGKLHEIIANGKFVDIRETHAALAEIRAERLAYIGGNVGGTNVETPWLQIADSSRLGNLLTRAKGYVHVGVDTQVAELFSDLPVHLALGQNTLIYDACLVAKQIKVTEDSVTFGSVHGFTDTIFNRANLHFSGSSKVFLKNFLFNAGQVTFDEGLEIIAKSDVGINGLFGTSNGGVRGRGRLSLVMQQGCASMSHLIGGASGIEVGDLYVADLTVRPTFLYGNQYVPGKTTVYVAGDLSAGGTLNSGNDLTLVTQRGLNLYTRGHIGGTFTRVAEGEANFSNSVTTAAKAIKTQVGKDAYYARVSEQAPIIESQVKGKAEITGATFVAKRSEDQAAPDPTAKLIFLAKEITGTAFVVRDAIWGGYQERIGQRPTFIGDGQVVVLAEDLFHVVAPHLKAGPEGLTYGAVNGNTYTPAQPLHGFRQWASESTSSSGWWIFRSSETTTQVHTQSWITHVCAMIESAGPTTAYAERTTGTLIQPGVCLNSQGLFEFIGAQAYFPAVVNTMQHDVQSRTETSGFLSANYRSEGGMSSFQARSQGTTFIFPQGARFYGPVYMQCPLIESPFIDLRGGHMRLALGLDQFQYRSWEKEEDLFWKSVSQRSVESLSYMLPTITGELEIRNGHVDIEVIANRNNAFSKQIKLVNCTRELDWLIERYVCESFYAEGPTAALSAVIALAASIAAVATGGAALIGNALAGSVGLTTTATVAGVTTTSLTTAGGIVAAMGSAGFSALCAQSAMAIVMNKGNLGRAAQQLAGKDSIKALLMAMAAAGAIAGVGQAFGLPVAAADTKGLMGHVQRQALHQGVGAVMAIASGESAEDALKHAVVSGAAGVAGGIGANHIGDAYAKHMVDAVTHKLLHAGLGAATGALMGGEKGAVTGAMGAFVAETFADAFSPEKPMEKVKALEAAKGRKLTADEFTEYYGQELEDYRSKVDRVEDWAKITAATTALLTGQDVTIASMTATNAVENNFVLLAYYGVVAAGLAYSAYEVYNAYEEGGAVAALQQLGIEIVTDMAGAAVLRAGGKLAYKVGGAVYPSLEAAVGAVLDKTPGLRAALGKIVDKLVAAGDAIAHSALGKGVAKAEAALGRMEAKVGEKLGFRAGAQEAAEKVAKQEAKAAEDVAQNRAVHERYKKELEIKHNLSLSEAQLKEPGKIIAGPGAGKEFKNAEKFSREYGGASEDWVKKSSLQAFTKDGRAFETHWVENIKTGQRLEYKVKFPGGPK